MNLLIENINSAFLNQVDANVIKTLKGEFDKETLEKELVNLYFDKAIIDITAIKNYSNYRELFDFLSFFKKDNIILLLDANTSNEYISKLVQEGYYNFAKNVSGINYLVNYPNTYEDVKKYVLENKFSSPLTSNISAISNNLSEIKNQEELKNKNQIIIGIQNLTSHAGSTTMTYLIVKALMEKYNVQGIEMMKQDHIYLKDISISESTSLEDLKQKLGTLKDKEVIVIDLNDIDGSSICDYILYLVEPGIISLNKLLNNNKDYSRIFNEEKIILNRSSLKESDIPSFEYETGIKVFYNISNLNERDYKNQEIINLLIKLGFDKLENKGLFAKWFK